LFFALSDHKSFGLGKEVTGQHLLVFVVVDWVVAFCSKDEVGWDEFGALVQELVEGVLGVGGWLAEENWTCGVSHHLVVTGNRLAIGFHGQLLEVGRETVEVLVKSKTVSLY
jgi:hypothetical protein